MMVTKRFADWFELLLYEQEVRDQVGAGAAPERVELDPEVLKVEICFNGSSDPHFGHFGGACFAERTIWSNRSPHSLHLYSNIGMALLSLSMILRSFPGMSP